MLAKRATLDQDSYMTITDRTKENLGTSDTAIAHWRRMMIRQARALREGGDEPRGINAAQSYRVRSGATLMAKEKNVFEELSESLKATA